MLKRKTKSRSTVIVLLLVALLALPKNGTPQVLADDSDLVVNVVDSLSVTITTPSAGNWATGNYNDFLKNEVSVSVVANSSDGFTVSMYSSENTSLKNTSKPSITLPTLESNATCSSATCTEFTANHWGYSLDGSSNTATYRPMVSTSANPITLIAANSGTTTGSKDIYFGAKADMTQAAGTYTGTVVINVVTGSITSENPITPTDPATNEDTTPNVATYNQPKNRTVHYVSSTNPTTETTTTTAQVSTGDVTSSYVAPAGVIRNTTSDVDEGGSPLAIGLAATASAVAAAGIFFFVLAKRDDDDEEDENNA